MAEPARLNSETAQAIATGMPACPVCGGRNVRPSQAMRIEDQIRAWFRFTPFRCRTCQNRFYKRPKPAPAQTTSPSEG
jgi:hypothetical protein